MGSHLPLICIWDPSLKESGSAGFKRQTIGFGIPAASYLRGVIPDAICPSWAIWAGKLLILDPQGSLTMFCAEHTPGLPIFHRDGMETWSALHTALKSRSTSVLFATGELQSSPSPSADDTKILRALCAKAQLSPKLKKPQIPQNQEYIGTAPTDLKASPYRELMEKRQHLHPTTLPTHTSSLP